MITLYGMFSPNMGPILLACHIMRHSSANRCICAATVPSRVSKAIPALMIKRTTPWMTGKR